MSQSTIGIDVSKLELVVALLHNNKTLKASFNNDQKGFKKLNTWIQSHSISNIKICCEATGNYSDELAKYLYEEGYELYVANPLAIKSFGKSKLARNKTDHADAVIIAEYIKVMECRSYQPLSKTKHEIRYMYRCIDDLQKQLNGCRNHLENERVVPAEVVKVWKSLSKIIEKKIERLDKEIVRIIEQEERLANDYSNLQTIVGVGKKTAIAIIAETPDIEGFESARQFAAYAGLTPRQSTSGTSVKGKSCLSKMGSVKLRKALYFPAIVAKGNNKVVQAFCKNLEAKGKKPMVIVCAAMRKLAHIIFGILRNKEEFHINKFAMNALENKNLS